MNEGQEREYGDDVVAAMHRTVVREAEVVPDGRMLVDPRTRGGGSMASNMIQRSRRSGKLLEMRSCSVLDIRQVESTRSIHAAYGTWMAYQRWMAGTDHSATSSQPA